MKKKIFFVTGSRAEYGQFSHFIEKLSKIKSIDLKLIVTGMHLYKKYGSTYKDILQDGFKIYKKINIYSNVDNELTTPLAVSVGIKKFSVFFQKNRPDLLCLPCDRYEILAAGLAAHYLNIPIVHFFGGEKTLGSQDDINRDILSRLAQLNLVSNKLHLNVIKNKLQNCNSKTFVIGTLAFDKINNTKILPRSIVEKRLSVNLKKKTILITYHPVTNFKSITKFELDNLLEALSLFKDINIIFTMPNNDYGNSYISNKIKKFCRKNKSQFKLFSSLGQELYYSLLKYINLAAGNSSSLLYEVPFFRKYSINIGIRQKGRNYGDSVINVKADKNYIFSIIRKFLEYKNREKNIFFNPYFKKNSTNKAIKIILNYLKSKKKFD